MPRSSGDVEKLKLPRRMAGLRLPAVARKAYLKRFLNSTAGQVLLAEALVLACADLAP